MATSCASVPNPGAPLACRIWRRPLKASGLIDTVSPTETPTAPTAAAPALPLEPQDAQPAVTPAPAEELPPVEEPAPPEPTGPSFAELELSEPVLKAIAEKGYTTPTPIQAQAIPWVLMGRDLLGCAQTGTGKTASFALPMLDILSGSRARARMPRSLILEPTRELAMQVAENFVDYGKYLKIAHALIIGGESMSDQRDLLMRGVDVLIATPGRLIDMFERGGLLLTDTKILVIDEADRMLDMGFIPDVERIVAMLPKTRQTMFFSATMAPEIRRLADAFLQNPKAVTVSKPATVAATITEALARVAQPDKREALRRLIRQEDVQNALIFCNRKRDVDILYKSLTKHGFSVGALHGDMPQSARFSTMEKFKAGELRLLCCSDVAARGIDIGGLSHVFNFDVPIHAEDYVHRIGRTGRAGLEGRAFTLASPDDRLAVEAIQKLTGHPIPMITIDGLDDAEWSEDDGRHRGRGRRRAASAAEEPRKPAPRSRRRGSAKAGEATVVPATEEPTVAAEPTAKPARAPRRSRGTTAAKEAPRTVPAEALPPEPVAPEPIHAEYARPERDARSERDARPERDFRTERGREGRRRHDDDLGPAVLGFGDEVPAFMLIDTRARRAAVAKAAVESPAEEDLALSESES